MDTNNILLDFNSQFQMVESHSQLEEIRIKYLGKKGIVTELFLNLKSIDESQKKSFGAIINNLRNQITQQIDNKKQFFDDLELNSKLLKQKIDITQPIRKSTDGFIHPISKTIKEVREIFSNLGFTCADGPEIEEDFFNFSALNMPKDHPARQMQDTFYFANSQEKLLRTHTSNVQIRKMLENPNPPIKNIAIGRVFRRDSDQTHTPMFHQIEGFMVDEESNMSHLKWVLEEFLKQFFEVNDINLRFRPSFFPFTEPSAEVDIGYSNSQGRIKIGSNEKYLEILGCGMIHPNVLQNCKINREKYQGFAFGIGIERLTMLKYGINDLRMLFENDLRFLKHFGFKSYEF